MTRLKKFYSEKIAPDLMSKFGYKSPMEVPKVTKVIVNMGLGEAIQNVKILDKAVQEIRTITGQQPIITKASKSVAAFKLSQGMSIGAKVTLRRDKMYEFLDRLISIALPRVREFRGVSPKAFDGRGNYSLGIKEQIIFPEIVYDKVDRIQGMNITLVTTAKTDEEGLQLLKLMGMPFRK